MKPTHEQQAVLACTERVIRINARAGSGKTTTLNMIARKHRDRKMLYLVFNRRAKEEADHLFPDNVKSFTLHAFAFRHEGRKWKDHIDHFSPSDLLEAFADDASHQQMLAALTHGFLTFFLNSPLERLEDAKDPFARYLKDDAAGLFHHGADRIISAARTLATAWNKKEKPCPHDFYLKLFHKSGAFARELNRFDTVLVDEGQDLSPIMLDALENCKKRIVLVGDTHQQIYSFRYATDAMKKLTCEREFDLTLSFRFGKAIAGLAAVFIQEAKREKGFTISGNPGKTSKVRFYENLGPIKNPDTAILSRTNLSLFKTAMELRAQGRPFTFERDIQSILWRTLDLYRLFQDDADKIKDKFISSFENLDQLKNYADEMDDFQLKSMCLIVCRYAGEFPHVVFEMAKRCEEKTPHPTAVTLSTVHSAKGRQYANVFVDADIAGALDSDGTETILEDEINLAYVGFTRAKENLYLHTDFKYLLTPAWQNYLARGTKTGRTRIIKPDHQKRSAAPLPRRLTGKTHIRKIRPEKPVHRALEKPCPKIGDRVKTVLGFGMIIDIKDKDCLVRLENQSANVWQRPEQCKEIPDRSVPGDHAIMFD